MAEEEGGANHMYKGLRNEGKNELIMNMRRRN